MANTSLPQEMRDLLIRLDQRVDDGFKNIISRLDAAERRADGQDKMIGENSTRITALENWRATIEGGTKGVGVMAKVMSALLGAAITVAGFLGLQVVTHSEKPVARATVEVAAPVAKPK